MVCEDHAIRFYTESSAIGKMQRRSGEIRKEHHNPQAEALQCPLDNFLTGCTESPISPCKSQQHARISQQLRSK